MRQIAESGDFGEFLWALLSTTCTRPLARSITTPRSPLPRCTAQALRNKAATIKMNTPLPLAERVARRAGRGGRRGTDLSTRHIGHTFAQLLDQPTRFITTKLRMPRRHGRIGPSIENRIDQEFIGLAGEIGGNNGLPSPPLSVMP